MKLSPVISNEKISFPFANIPTTQGILSCFRMGRTTHIVHLNENMEAIGDVDIPSLEEIAQGASFHRINSNSFILAIEIRSETRFKKYSEQHKDGLEYMIVEFRPAWYSVSINDNGSIPIQAIDFWKNLFYSKIKSIRINEKIHWFAIQKFPPKNAEETDLIIDGKIKSQLVYAVTTNGQLPQFELLPSEFIPNGYIEYEIALKNENEIILAFNIHCEEIHLCSFDLKNKSLQSKNISIRGQKNGIKANLCLLKENDGKFYLLWTYNNKKVKRETRDIGIWFFTFNDIDEKFKTERLSEDKEVCWNNFMPLIKDENELFALWTNGFSLKKAEIKMLKCNLATQAKIEVAIPGNPNEIFPKYLYNIKGNIFVGEGNRLWKIIE